jgi:hypothetical protein
MRAPPEGPHAECGAQTKSPGALGIAAFGSILNLPAGEVDLTALAPVARLLTQGVRGDDSQATGTAGAGVLFHERSLRFTDGGSSPELCCYFKSRGRYVSEDSSNSLRANS